MDWKKYLIVAACILAAIIALLWGDWKIQRLTEERDRYRGNSEALMEGMEFYRVRDSLSAAKVEALELKEKEFERFRAEDAALIQSLKAKNRDLAAVNKSQAETIISLMAVPRDTIIIRDSVKIPALVLESGDSWYTFKGLLADGIFTGELQNRDSLVIAETVKYKRFLGFLWKTHKVESRQMDCVSLNPHTKITGIEYIVLEK